MVTDDMLVEISEVDYGTDADEHLAALHKIRDSGRPLSPLEWKPLEVLELMRWSEPDEPEPNNRSSGQRGHIMRAFCCAALLRAAADPVNKCQLFVDSQNEALGPLIDSAVSIDRGLPAAAASFLTWGIDCLDEAEELRPFFGFGLLALALLSAPGRFSESDADELVAFIERAEICARNPPEAYKPHFDFIVGSSFLQFTVYNQRHSTWRSLAARLRSGFPDWGGLAAMARRIEAG